MNVVKEISRINELEIRNEINLSGSWHDQYKDSAYIFIGGIPYDLSEQDVICVFSQYGEVVDFNLVRDKETGKSKGFAFLAYEDQRSTVLAVDNFNGTKLLGRVLRVDHVAHYKKPKKKEGEEEEEEEEYQIAPQGVLPEEATKQSKEMTKLLETLDPDDPMKDYLIEKQERRDKRKHKKHKHRHHKHSHRRGKTEDNIEDKEENDTSETKKTTNEESKVYRQNSRDEKINKDKENDGKDISKKYNASTSDSYRKDRSRNRSISRSRSRSRNRNRSRSRSISRNRRNRSRSRSRSRSRHRSYSKDRNRNYSRDRSYSRDRYRRRR